MMHLQGRINSFGAIGYFRELSPAIFLRPNTIKHALYSIFALYSPITDAGIELSSRVIIVSKI